MTVWYWGRPTPEELRQNRDISRKCRPDWNPLVPDLRRHWEADDRSLFYLTPDLEPVSQE